MTAVRDAVPSSVDAVLARLRELGARLPGRDGVAVFNRVYLAATEEVRRRLAAGRFADPVATAYLDADFAARYLAAVDGAGRPPACWRPLLGVRRHGGVHPLQFALAGINAHIGHDLPLAVVATCRARGLEPDRLRGDYERVGDALAGIEERVREELMPGPDVLDVADPLTHLAAAWSLDQARDAAWSAARTLWSLRHLPDVYAECEQRLAQTAGLVSRCLLVPLAPP